MLHSSNNQEARIDPASTRDYNLFGTMLWFLYTPITKTKSKSWWCFDTGRKFDVERNRAVAKKLDIRLNKSLLQKPGMTATELQRDKRHVLAAVKRDGASLNWASVSLKNDKEVVLVAVCQNPFALKYASDILKNDKEVIMKCVQRDGFTLRWAHECLRNDKDVVLAAVKQNGRALQWASESLRGDTAVVLHAVKQLDWQVVQWASMTLRTKLAYIVVDSLVTHKGFIYFLHGLRLEFESPHEYSQSLAVQRKFPSQSKLHRPLQLLSIHGRHISTRFKKLIAEFAGITFGKELTLRREVARRFGMGKF